MVQVKKYGILAGKFLAIFLVGSIILSIFEYLFLNSKITHIVGSIYLCLSFLIIGYKEAKTSSRRGFITGIITGLFLILILLFFNIILFQSHFKFLRILYYLILLIFSILGGILGKNNQKNE